MILYHGTCQKTKPFTMYFSPEIEDAKQYALGLDDCGHYNKESFIYTTEIDETQVSIEDDFLTFDSLAYENPSLNGYEHPIVHNPETGWYIVKSPVLNLHSHYKNNL